MYNGNLIYDLLLLFRDTKERDSSHFSKLKKDMKLDNVETGDVRKKIRNLVASGW